MPPTDAAADAASENPQKSYAVPYPSPQQPRDRSPSESMDVHGSPLVILLRNFGAVQDSLEQLDGVGSASLGPGRPPGGQKDRRGGIWSYPQHPAVHMPQAQDLIN